MCLLVSAYHPTRVPSHSALGYILREMTYPSYNADMNAKPWGDYQTHPI